MALLLLYIYAPAAVYIACEYCSGVREHELLEDMVWVLFAADRIPLAIPLASLLSLFAAVRIALASLHSLLSVLSDYRIAPGNRHILPHGPTLAPDRYMTYVSFRALHLELCCLIAGVVYLTFSVLSFLLLYLYLAKNPCVYHESKTLARSHSLFVSLARFFSFSRACSDFL